MWKWFIGGCLFFLVLSFLVSYLLGQSVPVEFADTTHLPVGAAAGVGGEPSMASGDAMPKVGVLTHAQEHLTHRVRPVRQQPLSQGILPQ